MEAIISVLTYLGLTPDKVLPLCLTAGVALWIGYKFIAPIKKSVARITHACIEIQTIFNSHGISLQHHLVEAPGSPLQPTAFGEKLIKDSGLEKILDDQNSFLKTELSKRVSEKYTEYDVQEKARSFLLELKDTNIMNPVKKYAYDNGLDVDVILKAGGLWLRDDFLGKQRAVKKDEKE